MWHPRGWNHPTRELDLELDETDRDRRRTLDQMVVERLLAG
jgi:hypothetical protein